MAVTHPNAAVGSSTVQTGLTPRLASHVHALAGEIGERNIWQPQALEAAAAYIHDQWTRRGYAVNEQSYEVDGVVCTNLEVALNNVTCSPGIVIGAHYDTVRGSPGADDNASGVAALLELSRLLRDAPIARDVRFVAFVNEEVPFFATGSQGSAVYARGARQEGMDIELMISLEMLGYYSARPGSQSYPPLFRFFYPDRGNFLAMVSNLRCYGPLRRFVTAFRGASDFPVESLACPPLVPGLSWSDHFSFWQQGYAAIMVTDTAFYRYAYYHTPLDTPQRVCFPELARVTLGLAGAIEAFARG